MAISFNTAALNLHHESEVVIHGGYSFIPFRNRNAFERFEDWALSMTRRNIDALDFIPVRCALTGEIYAHRLESETELLVRSMIGRHNFESIDAEYKAVAPMDFMLRIWDDIANRFITAMRPSHAFALGNSRDIIALMSRERQTTALMVKLICNVHNNGIAEQFLRGSQGAFNRNVLVLQLADLFDKSKDDVEFGALYAALVELDAKYNIDSLAMINKEKRWFASAYENLLDGKAWDINAFIRAMILHRDEVAELNVDPRWSLKVYSTKQFHAFATQMAAHSTVESRSNVIDPNENKPSNRHVEEYKRKMAAKSAEKQATPKSAQPKSKASKPLTEKQQLREKLKASFSFGNISMGN